MIVVPPFVRGCARAVFGGLGSDLDAEIAAPGDASRDARGASGDVGLDASACPSDFAPCGGVCVDLRSDPRHCGGCSIACGDAGGACVDGVCSSCDPTETECANAADDDCDGARDCADPECAGSVCDAAGGTCLVLGCCGTGGPERDCADGSDDDCDGLVDCADPDCGGLACAGGGRCVGTTCCIGAARETSCGDGMDDDCDLQIDCADIDCAAMRCGDDGAFCNGEEICAGATCSGHRGNPCTGTLVCDEDRDRCVGCTADAACPTTAEPWGPCVGSSVCALMGTQTRVVHEGACVADVCTSRDRNETRSCPLAPPSTCGPPTSTPPTVCAGFSHVCDGTGTRSYTMTTPTCSAGSCVPVTTMITEPCMRPTDGLVCSPTYGTGFGPCEFEGDPICDGSGLRGEDFFHDECLSNSCSRQVLDFRRTEACTRPTGGTPCPGGVCTGDVCACPGGSLETACSDGADNDCDGLADCADLDCGFAPCGPFGRVCVVRSCTCLGGGVEDCENRVDDDCDGSTDCADADCDGQICRNMGTLACANGASPRNWCFTCGGGVCQQNLGHYDASCVPSCGVLGNDCGESAHCCAGSSACGGGVVGASYDCGRCCRGPDVVTACGP
jgi:hypothetical protein